jgi:hypothetical protein
MAAATAPSAPLSALQPARLPAAKSSATAAFAAAAKLIAEYR